MDNSTALNDHIDMPMNLGHRMVPSFTQMWVNWDSSSRLALLDSVDKYEVLS